MYDLTIPCILVSLSLIKLYRNTYTGLRIEVLSYGHTGSMESTNSSKSLSVVLWAILSQSRCFFLEVLLNSTKHYSQSVFSQSFVFL